MGHPKLDDVYKSIAIWAKEQLAIASLLSEGVHYEFVKVLDIRKLWRENNVWLVDATLEYKLDKRPTHNTMTFQLDDNLSVLGFDFHAPRIVPS